MNSDPPFPPEPSIREQLLHASAEAIIEQAALSEAHPNHATHSASMRVEALLHEIQVYRVELEMQNETLRESQIALEASHKCYMDLYDLAPVGYLTLSQAGLILQINPMGATLLGEPRQKLNLRSFAQFVADDHRNCWNEFVISLWGKKFEKSDVAHTQHCELSLLRNDGNRFYVRLDCRLSQLEGVETLHITLIDITQQRDNEEQSRIAAIAFETQESMLITDANGLIVRGNSAFTKRTGYSVNETIGLPIDALSVGHHDPAYFRQMRETANQNGVWQGELWNCNKLGRDCVQWLTLSAVVSPAGAISHYVAAITDTSSSKQAEAEIHRLAYYDTLTGLPNRRLFFDRMRQAMLRSSRDTNFGALIFLDLDNFKRLNDTQGHSVGDQLLVGIAKSILLCVRERDTVARLGGDEFVVIVETLGTDASKAIIHAGHLAEKIRTKLTSPVDLDGRDFYTTASFGICLFQSQEESIETLLKQADLAMYQAKSTGRNTLCFFDPIMQIVQDSRSTLETDMRMAVEREELHLVYQPQFHCGHIIGVEALLRWIHPHRGLVWCEEFIPLAEETDLILSIGQWVLETACAQLTRWAACSTTCALSISVNVSERQFRRPEFVAQVVNTLAMTNANPRLLQLELTESLMINNPEEVIERMQALKALGIQFSMDDFGTGFSSLSYLKRLPLDQIKIDRSFVRDIGSDSDDVAIVQTIITLANAMKLQVIAEGVETTVQLEHLAELGCEYYQGYLFSPPLSLENLEGFFKHHHAR